MKEVLEILSAGLARLKGLLWDADGAEGRLVY